MIVLRLNGADISLTRAFIPLWVVDGILLIGVLAVMCLKLCDDGDDDDCSTKCGTCGFAMFALCVVAMLPLFKGLLAAVDAGTLAMSMRTLCIPLFIFFVLACLGLTFIAFMIAIGQNHDD